MIRRALTLFFSLFFVFGLMAQPSSLPYLVELEAVELSGEDSASIRKLVLDYQNASHDTARLSAISEFIDQCWNDDLWPLYNELMLKEATKGQKNSDGEVLRSFLYYEATALGNRAYSFDVRGDFERAEEIYLEAYEKFQQANRVEGQLLVANALAMIQETRGNWLEAIAYFSEVVIVAEKYQQPEARALALNNLAQIEMKLGRKEAAQKRYEDMLESALQAGDLRLEGWAEAGLAGLQFVEGDVASAVELCRSAAKKIRASGAYTYLTSALFLQARIYQSRQQLDSMSLVVDELLRIVSEGENYEELAHASEMKAELEASLGNVDAALASADYAYKLSTAIQIAERIRSSSKLLARLYEQVGDFERANSFLNTYVALKDSLINDEVKMALMEQGARQEYAQNLAQAEREKEQQQMMVVFASAIALVVFLALLMSFAQNRKIRKQQLELTRAYAQLEEQKEFEVLASNLKALQSQMNPHFIFNALNSIQTLVLKGDSNSSYSYINRFASLIRKTLDFSERRMVSIREEISLLEDYLELEKLRFQDQFSFKLQAPHLDDLQIPPMLLQPLLENALQHGLIHKEGSRRVEVLFELNEEGLQCVVRDNGIGRKAAATINERQRPGHKSFATQALRKRFEYLKKEFGDQIGFWVLDLEKDGQPLGTQVRVKLPYVKSTSNR